MKNISRPNSPEINFSSIEGIRSDSDDGTYIASVKQAVESYCRFKNFKRDPAYCTVLEHVTQEQGKGYLDVLENRKDGILEQALNSVLMSDSLGNPRKFVYRNFGPLSPTTLRYVKVASDLHSLFGCKIGADIAEIGGGYGGQMLVCDKIFEFATYNIFDLYAVNQLIAKYLESFLLNNCYTVRTLNSSRKAEFDLVISNYAFSELPKAVQKKFIEKIMTNSLKGYITMNSVKGKSSNDENKFSVDELRQLLPPFEIFDENPLTAKHNYIIVWGHNNNSSI